MFVILITPTLSQHLLNTSLRVIMLLRPRDGVTKESRNPTTKEALNILLMG
jgi:hypothetical protein